MFAAVVLLPFSLLILLPIAGLSQGSGTQLAAVPAAGPASIERSSASQTNSPQAAQDAAPYPSLRFVIVLCLGLVINATLLARKFRLLLGLGVFANLYAPLFMVCGAGICGISAMAGHSLIKTPSGLFGPYFADLAGPVLTSTLGAVGLKSQARPNPILGWLEDCIGDCIQQRIQAWVVPACDRYSWATIQLGARYALANARAEGQVVTDEKFEELSGWIDKLPDDADPHPDLKDKGAALKYKAQKYTALANLLSWCQFSKLRRDLERAASEMQG